MGLGKRKNGKKIFNRKPYDKNLYKWSPTTDDRKSKKRAVYGKECTAEAGSQGEDWDVTYVYEKVITSGVEHRIAYVECDYVQ